MPGFLLVLAFAALQSADRPAQLPAPGQPGLETRVFIVRHAEKDTSVTSCPGGGTICQPLTAAGQARAEELARLMKNQNLTRIYSTEYKRTQDTAKPSDRHPSIWTSLPARDHQKLILEEIAKAPGNYLIVTHSDSALHFLRSLMGNGDMAITSGAMPNMATVIDDPDYDNLFLVTLDASGAKSCKHYFYGAKAGGDLAISGCPAQGRLPQPR